MSEDINMRSRFADPWLWVPGAIILALMLAATAKGCFGG